MNQRKQFPARSVVLTLLRLQVMSLLEDNKVLADTRRPLHLAYSLVGFFPPAVVLRHRLRCLPLRPLT